MLFRIVFKTISAKQNAEKTAIAPYTTNLVPIQTKRFIILSQFFAECVPMSTSTSYRDD